MRLLQKGYRKPQAILLVIVLSVACLASACPQSQSQLDKAVKATHTVSVRYRDVVTFVTTVYTSGAISRELKDKIADALIVFGRKGEAFNNLLAQYSAQYKDGKVPASVWSVIAKNFDELSAEFLTLVNFVPQAAGLANSQAFRAISAAIMILANLLITHGINVPRFQDMKEGVTRYGLA